MNTADIDKLSIQLVHHSLAVKEGDTVLVEYDGEAAHRQALSCADHIIKSGGIPVLQDMNFLLRRSLIKWGTALQHKKFGKIYQNQMKAADSYLAIRGAENIYELSGPYTGGKALFLKYFQGPVLQTWIGKPRWVVTRYPNPSMAQLAEQSTEDFEDFYFKVCCLDYKAMEKAAAPLKVLMDNTDKVFIKSNDTELHLSIKGIGSLLSVGRYNIPDGECMSAPVKNSVNGTVVFNCKTIDRSEGVAFNYIKVTFADGKAVKAEAESNEKTEVLNRILNRDAGASYIGEFALSFNPHIKFPITDILFDEKIDGSFHMAFGNAFNNADNGNRSMIHWDLIQIQRQDFGGGEIWFDGKLIRKDGKFVPGELQGLNPENLLK